MKKGKKHMEENPQWKGDDVGFNSLHEWIRNHKPKTNRCEMCNEEKRLEIANISGEYKRDITDYKWLCRRCHMESDGRLNRIISRNKSIEFRDKMSIGRMGENNPMYGKTPWLGRHHTKETKRKISMAKRKNII
jgi:hypothetical protein